jgi:flagellar biosynthesis GTPase FlhF
VWAVPDKDRDVSSISQVGVFTARGAGIYHVFVLATTGKSSVLKTVVANVTVLGSSEF